jgi:hypothetical protein
MKSLNSASTCCSLVLLLALAEPSFGQDETERLFWETVDCGAEAEVRAYIREYPEGAFFDEAIECLRGMGGGEPGSAENEPGTPEEIETALGLTRADRELVQLTLAAYGYDVGTPDGVFGERTRAGLRRYQSDNDFVLTGYLDAAQAEVLVAEGRAISAEVQRLRRDLPDLGGYSDAVLALVLTHPAFQDAPAVGVRSYGYQQTFPNDPGRPPVVGTISYREVRSGLVYAFGESQDGRIHESLTSVSGQLWLSQRTKSGETEYRRRSTTISDISGDLFPMRVGGRFGFTRTFETGPRPETEQRMKVDYEVVDRLAGSSIDPLLPGEVYKIIVRQEYIGAGNVDIWEGYYNEKLGMIMTVGPVKFGSDPRSHGLQQLTDLQLR